MNRLNRANCCSAGTFTLAAIASLSLSLPASAGKGGTKGKPGGDDGGEPPPVVIPDLDVDSPIASSLITFDAKADAGENVPWANAAEVKLFFEDVNKNGVACGMVDIPDAESPVYGSWFGIIATVGGGIQELDVLFAHALAQPEFRGLRIQGAWEINGNGQIACELTGEGPGDYTIAIADLRDFSLTIVNTVAPSVYGLPGGGPIVDLNEKGDVVSYEGSYTGKGRKQQYVRINWLNIATGSGGWNAPVELSGVRHSPYLNTTPEQLAYFSDVSTIVRRDLSTTADELLVDDLSSLDSMSALHLRLADDGDVYFFKTVDTNDGRQGYPVRWVEGQGLQPLKELQNLSSGPQTTLLDVSKSLVESETVEALLGPSTSSDFDLEIYQPGSGLGLRYPVEVTNEGPTDVTSYRPTAISRPNASGHGHICGWANKSDGNKGGFILVPATP